MNNKTLLIILLIVFVIIIGGYFLFIGVQKPSSSSQNGTLSQSNEESVSQEVSISSAIPQSANKSEVKKREKFQYEIIERNDTYLKAKIVFNDYGKNISGLLTLPISNKKVPAILVLPAASATKESREWYGDLLKDMGYASLIIDQRGIGESGGDIHSIMEDYSTYQAGGIPTQNLFVEDAINATNVLSSIKEIDKNKIAILGESMGGRYAIIAAAKDERIKIALIISSAGFKGNYSDEKFNEFVATLNPNYYIGKITPRKVVMFHSDNDTVVLIDDANYTYSFAKDPKEMVIVHCYHGYCAQMFDKIKTNLQEAFSKSNNDGDSYQEPLSEEPTAPQEPVPDTSLCGNVGLSIVSTMGYTCRNSSGVVLVEVARDSTEGVTPAGIKITVYGGGQSISFNIIDKQSAGVGTANVSQIPRNYSGASLDIPRIDEARTYLLNTGLKATSSVSVAPIIKNNNSENVFCPARSISMLTACRTG